MAQVDEPVVPVTAEEAVAATVESQNPPPSGIGGYAATYWQRVKGGDTGVLPVVAGLLLVSILFQSRNSNFLTAGNLVNLLTQAAFFSLLAMGEVFALLLGEIDLSIGWVAGISGVVTAELVKPAYNWPWWAAVAVALAICAAIGLLQGSLITRLGLPSFVVTLAGLLFWQGVVLRILGEGGAILVQNAVIIDVYNGRLTRIAGWVLMLVVVGIFAVLTWRRDSRRRASGLVAPPVSVTILKIVGTLAGSVLLIWLVNINRGRVAVVTGLPWVIILVITVLIAWTYLLGRTRYGRYVYAIGGNAEGARRAGIALARTRTVAFMLCSFTAGIAGIVYVSRLNSISTALNGGTYVLYAVAAAVIGGTSLFGGRGKAIHAVLGGLVIAAIDNGMGLIGISAASQYMVTALVLLVAVIIDALSSRNRTAR